MSDALEDQFATMRREMTEQIARHARHVVSETGRSELSPKVLRAMERVPRHEFVPAELRAFAYVDSPLPIGFDKTISQPFIVALMTDALDLRPDDKVLEVGTGLGYQAAVLAELAGKVYSIEIIEELARSAQRRLDESGVENVEVVVGDGSRGWFEHAPFDKVLVAAAPDLIPTALLSQLKAGGRMIIPAGLDDAQKLIEVDKSPGGRLRTRELLAVRFSALASGG